MNLAKFFSVITIAAVLCSLCSCAKGGNDLNAKISPSDKSLIELVSKTYDDLQLLEIAQFNGTINELSIQFPIECLRCHNGKYRASYLGIAKVAILVFDDSGSKILGSIYNTEKLRSDFGELKKGQTLENVQKIDPHGEYLFLYTGRNDTPKISSHYTKDGYLITIQYDDACTIIDIVEELI